MAGDKFQDNALGIIQRKIDNFLKNPLAMSSEFRAALRGRRSALQQTICGRDSGGEPQKGQQPVSVTEWVNLTPVVHA